MLRQGSARGVRKSQLVVASPQILVEGVPPDANSQDRRFVDASRLVQSTSQEWTTDMGGMT